MDEQSNPSLGILRSRLLGWLQEYLESAGDTTVALRKSLLGLLYVTSGQPSLRRFRDYMLRDFRPLADSFDEDGAHPFVGGQDIRLLDRFDGTELLIHQSLIEAVMKEPLEADDFENADVHLPWDIDVERIVGCFILHDFYPQLIRRGDYGNLVDISAELREAVTSMETFGPWTDEPAGPMNYPGYWVRTVQMGELIFVFSRDASVRSQITMQLAAQTLFTRAINFGFGLRGGIAFGDCTVNFEDGVFVGFAMFLARQLAARQAWFGVSFDPSMENLTAQEDDAAPPPDIGDWIPISVPYAIPTSVDTGTEELSALNWPMFYKNKPNEMNDFLASVPDDGDPRFQSFMEATKAFGHEMLRQMNIRAAHQD